MRLPTPCFRPTRPYSPFSDAVSRLVGSYLCLGFINGLHASRSTTNGRAPLIRAAARSNRARDLVTHLLRIPTLALVSSVFGHGSRALIVLPPLVVLLEANHT
jgi:hypothetical protein